MEGLLPLLLIAVFFYVMMRFGCGAHMIYGHHGHPSSTDADDTKHVDPVCGKRVPPDEGYGMVHEDRLYRFCSRECLDAFETQPGHYLAGEAPTTS